MSRQAREHPPVTVREVAGNRLRIRPIEVVDGTPVVDIKPVDCECARIRTSQFDNCGGKHRSFGPDLSKLTSPKKSS